MDNLKIQGILTSRIETKNKENKPYYYGFFKIKDQATEIPVIFKDEKGNYKPQIPKGSQVQLTGQWAKSNGSRPSFTCHEYQILKDPPPLTTKSLKEQIQSLLTSAWEHQKHWTQTTKFLTKKQEQLKELEKYQKHPQLLRAYLELKAFYYSNEGQQELRLSEQSFISTIASELEPLENQIKALQVKNNPSQALDHFVNNSIEIMSEALAEKDKVIRELQQQLVQKEVSHE